MNFTEADTDHPSGRSIDRRSGLSYAEFVSEYLLPQRPVIITDALTEWPAMSKWTPEYFKTFYGDKRITIENSEMRLAEYIDLVVSSTEERPAPYFAGFLIRQQFPEIAPDIEPELKYTLPDRIRSRLMIGKLKTKPGVGRLGVTELLIGGPGAKFMLHYDTKHLLGYVTQIYGDKEFLLFAPDDGRYLYPYADTPNRSSIPDAFAVDLEKFPLFDRTTPYRFVLGAGETIFNPPGWWHTTRMLSPSIAMVISTVNASNWNAYRNDVVKLPRGIPKFVRVALSCYLSLVGIILSVQEWLFFDGF